jgi:acyl dehydratase
MSEPGRRSYAEVEVGEELAARSFEVDRGQLVRYAGASLDFNPIHWSDLAAERAGLPNVIAHGMLTMALAGRVASDWAGDPGAVVDFAVRFSAVVAVEAGAATPVWVRGRVEEKLGEGLVALGLVVESGEREVLKGARAVVRLAAATYPELI